MTRGAVPVWLAAAGAATLLAAQAGGMAAAAAAPAGALAAQWAHDAACVVAPLALYVLWRRRRGLAARPGGRALAAGWALGAGLAAATVALTAAAGGLTFGAPPGAVAGAALLAPALLLHGAGEELALRGVAQEALAARVGLPVAIAAGACLFAGLQAVQGYRAPHALINCALAGAAFGLIAARWGAWAAAAAHGGWTWTEACLFGVAPDDAPGRVLAGVRAGAPGADLTASWALTVAALGLVAALAWAFRRRLRPPRGAG